MIMKKIYSFPIVSVLVVILFSACSMRNVSINTIRPADINVPSHIDTLLLLNRTYFSSQAIGIIEGILTGEMPGEDKAGTQAAMSSFQNTLAYSNRFVVKNAAEIFPGNSVTAAFPAPLSWSDIENLCGKYTTQAVVAIEIFDSDFIVTDGKRKTKKEVTENGVKKTIEVDEFFAKGVGNLKIGFRIYDPANKTIVDQQLVSQNNTWEAVGNSVQDALVRLIAKTEATRYLGGLAGNNYAYKIAPMPVTISRQFYKKIKGVPMAASAVRKADVNDWNGAMEIWKTSLAEAKTTKQMGRICYNVAVAYEVIGDLANAKIWANKAYVDYGNKTAKTYSAALNQREYDANRVQQQMQ
jgi:hypothetical protein